MDFRKGADGLAAVAKEALGQDPFSGTVIVFRARRADRVKIIVWDGSGLVMLWKALDEGAFKWPPISDGVMKLSAAQLAALLDGLDWTRVTHRDCGGRQPSDEQKPVVNQRKRESWATEYARVRGNGTRRRRPS